MRIACEETTIVSQKDGANAMARKTYNDATSIVPTNDFVCDACAQVNTLLEKYILTVH